MTCDVPLYLCSLQQTTLLPRVANLGLQSHFAGAPPPPKTYPAHVTVQPREVSVSDTPQSHSPCSHAMPEAVLPETLNCEDVADLVQDEAASGRWIDCIRGAV